MDPECLSEGPGARSAFPGYARHGLGVENALVVGLSQDAPNRGRRLRGREIQEGLRESGYGESAVAGDFEAATLMKDEAGSDCILR